MDDLEELELEAKDKPKSKRKANPAPSLDISLAEFTAMVEKREAEHRDDFDEDSITTADLQQMRAFAELSVLSELANRKAALMVLGDYAPQEIKYVSDAAKSMSAEARQLATSLGIDRKSRVTGQQTELEVYLPTLHAEAKDLLYKRAVAIFCPRCIASNAHVRLDMGMILYHFMYELPWSFTAQCPKCKYEYKINNTNYMRFTFAELESGVDRDKINVNPIDDEDLLPDDSE